MPNPIQPTSNLVFRAITMPALREDDTCECSISSEEPIACFCPSETGEPVMAMEILDHSADSIDMTRAADGLVVLDTHNGDQIGLLKNISITDRKLRGRIEFCSGQRAQEIKADAKKGLRKNLSVGYQRDATAYKAEGMHANGLPVMRLMRWMPYEASFVPIPADTNVGVGRDAKPETIEIKVADKPQTAEREKGAKMSDKAEMSAKDAAEAFAAGEVAGMSVKDVREMIDGGKSLAEIKDVAFRKLQSANEVAKAKAVKLDENQVREYSLINVIRSFIPGSRVDIGFEREVSDECAKHTGKRGFIIPHAVLGRRDLTKSGTSSASIATNLLASDYIDALRSKMVLAPLGVRFMGGLVGDVAIPKLGTLTGYWVQESSTITESAQTMGQVTGTPKTCGVTVDISRKMLLQSTPSAEDFCRNEIVERIARTVQIAVFQGTGANGQPSAITAATGINNPSVTQGTPTYAELLGFPGSIMADNAEGSAMKAVMTAEVWQKLAATFTDGTAKAERVLDYNSKTFLGFPYFVSEDVGANSLFFGDWSNVVVGLWGNGVEINADTASLSTQGALRLVGLQDVDVMVRNGQGLAYNSAVTA